MTMPGPYQAVVNKRRFDTATATLLADNVQAERNGNPAPTNSRATYLYRTERGAYFFLRCSFVTGESAYCIEPLHAQSAYKFFEDQRNKRHVDVAVAFPSVKIEEA